MVFKHLYIIQYPHTSKMLIKSEMMKDISISEQIHNEILSLPISPLQTIENTKKIVEVLNEFK